MYSSVFILFTPLHIILARSLIEEKDIGPSLILVFYEEDKKKILRYLPNRSDDCVFLFPMERGISAIKTLLLSAYKLRRYVSRDPVFYCAQLKSFYTRFLISSARDKFTLNTLDDGAANIVKGSFLGKSEMKKGRLFFGVYRKRFLYKNILKKINTHFTIYDEENVLALYANSIEKFEIREDIFSTDGDVFPELGKVILTAPFSEQLGFSIEVEVKAYNDLIEKYDIKYRLEHPAEHKKKRGMINAKTLDTDSVAEEVLIKSSAKREICVYGFGSSVLFNLARKKNIKCICAYSYDLTGEPVRLLKGNISYLEI